MEATNWTADALSSVIVNHVTNVVKHYKGKCYAWDVVNEALNEDGTYRESIFYTTLGEEYIKLAFSTAAKVDPDVKLYYNDYNLESPGNKSAGALRIVKLLKDAGIKIDGVGMQAHFVASGAPSLDQQIAVIDSYAALGVEVAYTELDVRIDLPLNDTNLEWQKQAYTNVRPLLLVVDEILRRLTFFRLPVRVSNTLLVSVSRFGTFTIHLAGSQLCSPAKAILCCGSKISASILHTTA